MYSRRMTKIVVTLDGDPSAAEALTEGSQVLRDLCQKEVESFDQYVRVVDPQFADGLSKWECRAIEGYLYQKLKGHIDAHSSEEAG